MPWRPARPEWTRRPGLTILLGVAGYRVRLTFPEHLIKEPVIGRMVRQFDVLPNIRRANIEDTFGWMVCELTGDRRALDQALAWLAETGVEIDRLGDVVEG
jgi:ABC-type methionine transport system ATPase subunit